MSPTTTSICDTIDYIVQSRHKMMSSILGIEDRVTFGISILDEIRSIAVFGDSFFTEEEVEFLHDTIKSVNQIMLEYQREELS